MSSWSGSEVVFVIDVSEVVFVRMSVVVMVQRWLL